MPLDPRAIVVVVYSCVAAAIAASECEFQDGVDIQIPAGLPGAGSELKIQKTETAQECCDACGETPGCVGAAWNGNSDAHLNTCYMKGAGAAIVSGKSSPGTITCQLKTDSGVSSRDWGTGFLLAVGLVLLFYVGGGVVLGGGSGGMRAHPHHQPSEV